MAQPSYTVDEYRFQNDAGSDAAPSWAAAANTDISLGVGSANLLLLRFQAHNNNNKAGNETFNWEYSLNGGTWTAITTATNVVRAATPTTTGFADGNDCGNRLTARGTFDTNNNGYNNTGIGTLYSASAGAYFETALAFYIPDTGDVANADDIEIRIVENTGDTITYGPTANITVDKVNALTRVIDEVVDADETTLQPRILARLIAEIVDANEVAHQAAVYLRITSETVNVNEVALSLFNLVKVISEAINSIETVASLTGIVRVVSETVNNVETVVRKLVSTLSVPATYLLVKLRRMRIVESILRR